MRTVQLNGRIHVGYVARVDDEDYELVSQYNWRVRFQPRGQIYADGALPGAGIGTSRIYMHILIMGAKGIDHIDHDGLNNQRYNLRVATQAQNGANQRKHLDGSSRFKGVSWSKTKRKWTAQITKDRRIRYLGRYHDEEEAARVYDAAAREAFGEFAFLNFPEECGEQLRRDRLP